MPYYNYQCHSCGLQFEKKVKITQRNDVKCVCGEGVELLVPDGVSYSFHNELTHDLPVPQNTGVSSLDFDYDKIIKEDSDKKWAVVNKRQEHKREILRANPGVKKYQLAKTFDGDYRVLNKEEEQYVLKGRATYWGQMQKIRESKR